MNLIHNDMRNTMKAIFKFPKEDTWGTMKQRQ